MTANPIDLVGGLDTTANVSKSDFVAWVKVRVTQVLADASEVNSTDLTGQSIIQLKSTGRTYSADTSDHTTADDGVNCLISSDGIRFKLTTIVGVNGIDGTSIMTRVRVVATSNVAIATGLANGQTVDGKTLVTNDLVLLTAETSSADNGVYVVPASGAASRATAFNSYDSMPGCYFSVMEGTSNADTLWRCTSDKGGTLGTTALAFEEFTSGGLAAPIVVNANGVAQPQFEMYCDDGTSGANLTVTTYNITGGGIIHANHANGTRSAPTQSLAGDITGGVGSRPHDGTDFLNSSPTSIHWVAAEDIDPTHHGSYLRLLTTPKGSTTRQERVILADTGTLWAHDTSTYDPKDSSQNQTLGSANGGQMQVSAQSVGASFVAIAYNNNNPGFRGGSMHGTPASPSATLSGQLLCFMGGHGYDGSAWTGGTKALISFAASENFDSAHQGTQISFETTPTASTTRAQQFQIGPGSHVYAPGAGTTASAANAFLNSGSTPANELLRSTSSRAYKRDIEPVEPDYADNVLKLCPVFYRSKCARDNPDWSWWGLIAEDVAAIDPRLVHWGYQEDQYDVRVITKDDGDIFEQRVLKSGEKMRPDAVQYERVAILLLDVVKRQQQRIEALEAKIAALPALPTA